MRSRGFAIIYAITALMFAGALVGYVTVGLRQTVDATSRGWTEAQVRQLLLAGDYLKRQGVRGVVKLPAEMPAGTELTIGADGVVMVRWNGVETRSQRP